MDQIVLNAQRQAFFTSARFVANSNTIRSTSVVWRNNELKKKITASHMHVKVVGEEEGEQRFVAFGATTADYGDVFISPSGKLKAIVVKKGDDSSTLSSSPSFFVDIYKRTSSGELLLSTTMAPKRVRSFIFSDDTFGSCEWQQQTEQYISFVVDDDFSFKDKKWVFDGQRQAVDEVDDNRFELTRSQDWGETFVGVKNPNILVFDLKTNDFLPMIDYDLEKYSAIAQPTFTHSTTTPVIYATAWPSGGLNKLGVKFCYNRFSKIVKLDMRSGTILSVVSDDGTHAFSPLISIASHRLLYLGAPTSSHVQHNFACAIYSVDDIDNDKTISRVLVEVAAKARDEDAYAGVYASNRLKSGTANENVLFTTTFIQSTKAIVMVDLSNGNVKVLCRNTTLLDVLFEASHAYAHLLTLKTDGVRSMRLARLTVSIKMAEVTSEEEIAVVEYDEMKETHLLPSITMSSNRRLFNDSLKPSEIVADAFVLLPSPSLADDNGRFPVILYPHGGPNSVYCVEPSIQLFAFLSAGYAVVGLNYRASLGFGQAPMNELIGNIGDKDVKDCIALSLRAFEVYAMHLDSSRPYVAGGSHGGFLACHLMFENDSLNVKAFSARNPVTSVLEQSVGTDIADWCVVNACGQLISEPWTESTLLRMHRCSPMSRVSKGIQLAPLLMILGLNDRRVPKEGGLNFAKRVKDANATNQVRTIVFEDNGHALDKVVAESMMIFETLTFFEQHK